MKSASRSERAVRIPIVVGGASLGTVFEWYDFFIYGSMASIIATHFFSGGNDFSAYIFTLLVFAVGFAVRPLGGLIFGAMGDRVGRKKTFLTTMIIMGVATFSIGLLPTRADIGILAPILLIAARTAQGLAIGGEYGGAAVYVAEHVSSNRKGLLTSFIQITATLGLLLSLVVTFTTRRLVGETEFVHWGWRLPFIFSIVLLAISVWLRLRLTESPEFEAAAAAQRLSKRPISDSLTRHNSARIAMAFCLSAGMTVVWYTSQFYALFFMERVLNLDNQVAIQLLTVALLIATPFFVVFGWLSDKIGRKPIILLGCLLAALGYHSLFQMLAQAVNPALETARTKAPVSIIADPAQCNLQFDPIGSSRFVSSCDIAKSALASAGISYTNVSAAAGTVAVVSVGDTRLASFEAATLKSDEFKARRQLFAQQLKAMLQAKGYPDKADPSAVRWPHALSALILMMLLATMCYGPLAAALTEMFPIAVRYTAVSLPYNIATGWIGGFLPAAAFAIVAASGDIYAGLWYPIFFASLTVVFGAIFLPRKGIVSGLDEPVFDHSKPTDGTH